MAISADLKFELHLLQQALDGIDANADDLRRFATLVRTRAILAETEAEPTGLKRSELYPGYFFGRMGERTLYVPFNLVPVFPRAEILSELEPVLSRAQVDPKSPLCISGSTAFLGRTRTVSDVDFCEYFMSDMKQLPELIQAKVTAGPSAGLCRIKINGRGYDYPFDDMQRTIHEQACVAEVGTPGRPVKLDFVMLTALFGTIPASNWIFPLDPRAPEDGNARFSFVFQEAVLTSRGGVPPRELLRGSSFASYLAWLLKESKALLTDTDRQASVQDWPVKALKRLLSLYLALGLRRPYVNNIIDFLNEGRLGAFVERIRAKMVRELCSAFESPLKEELCSGARFSTIENAVTDESLANALSEASELASSLLGELELWLEKGPT